MAQDMFIKIAGIEGESSDVAHKGEIEVVYWEWDIKQMSSMHFGSGAGAGKATVGDLIFIHYVDRASPNLMKYCFIGKPINQAVLTIRKAGGTPLEYMQITMDDVIVTCVHSVTSANEERVQEQINLSFSKVKQEYIVQNAQGTSAGAVTASFDIKVNREV